MGDNDFVFHPGYPNGAFRIDGPGGHDNRGMGFTPLQSGMNHVSIVVLAATGITTYTMSDSLNQGFFQETFADTNYQAGTTVLGLGVGGGGTAVFDNVRITASVPEPAAWALLVGGLLILGAAAGQRRG